MEELVGPFGAAIGTAARRKRSNVSHRPLLEPQPASENNYVSLSTSTTPSDDTSRVSGDDNGLRKEFNFNENVIQLNSCNRSGECEKVHETTGNIGLKVLGTDIGHDGVNRKRCSEGVLAPANWKSAAKVRKTEILSSQKDISGRRNDDQRAGKSRSSFDVPACETKVKKVKLKVGGITTTLQADNANVDSKWDRSSIKNIVALDSSSQRQRTVHQHKYVENDYSNKKSGLQGVAWRDFATSFSLVKHSLASKMKNGGKSETVRKSKRPPKRRVMEGVYDDEEEDEEIRYLEKLKATKSMALSRDGDDDSNKKRRLIQSLQTNTNVTSADYLKTFKDKSRAETCHEDADYEEEDELESDCEAEGNKNKQRKESVEFLMEGKKEMSLTSRQRALQSGKDSSTPAASSIEFPNGLPTAAPRKQKEKLSELEQQMKKAEAARRRRLQVEKAAKESEAEAIRKILGQDSSRKKKEEKMKKRKEELAQEKAANALVLAPNMVRWTMGPLGTTVTFHNDIDLPDIFESKPLRYPEPREICAGPSCVNPYRYRDSKSNLPICSLQCYKSVQLKAQTEPTC